MKIKGNASINGQAKFSRSAAQTAPPVSTPGTESNPIPLIWGTNVYGQYDPTFAYNVPDVSGDNPAGTNYSDRWYYFEYDHNTHIGNDFSWLIFALDQNEPSDANTTVITNTNSVLLAQGPFARSVTNWSAGNWTFWGEYASAAQNGIWKLKVTSQEPYGAPKPYSVNVSSQSDS